MNWIPYGPDGWLLQFAEHLGKEAFARGRAIALELERCPPPGLLEYVPAFTCMLLEFSPGACAEPQRRALRDRLIRATSSRPKPDAPKEIPVCYDGPDLARVAELHGLRIDEVVNRHARPIYHVYALGFAPGFPYLGDLDPRLHTPRLPSPRPRVAAGSVAIGGPHTGIYPVDGPGGWNLIGRTAVKLFDRQAWSHADSPAAVFHLHPGDRVKFVPVAEIKPPSG